jgi:hypothetical protein
VSHPDVHDGETKAGFALTPMSTPAAPAGHGDVAIDFVEMSAIVDRMRTAFFTTS